MRIRSVFSILTSVNNGNDNHNKQASYFIFSPFEAIFASSKFYKVARIYWVVALGKLSHRVHLDLFNHVNLFTCKQYCWIHVWNRILAFIQSFILIHHHLKWFQISFGFWFCESRHIILINFRSFIHCLKLYPTYNFSQT